MAIAVVIHCLHQRRVAYKSVASNNVHKNRSLGPELSLLKSITRNKRKIELCSMVLQSVSNDSIVSARVSATQLLQLYHKALILRLRTIQFVDFETSCRGNNA